MKARYSNTVTNSTYSGATYMNSGLNLEWFGDYQSQIIRLYRQ